MKIVPNLNSFSGTPYFFGEFDVTRIHGYENLTFIRVRDSWPEKKVFIENASVIRNENDVWKILEKLHITSSFARAIIKQVRCNAFELGQSDIKNKLHQLLS